MKSNVFKRKKERRYIINKLNLFRLLKTWSQLLNLLLFLLLLGFHFSFMNIWWIVFYDWLELELPFYDLSKTQLNILSGLMSPKLVLKIMQSVTHFTWTNFKLWLISQFLKLQETILVRSFKEKLLSKSPFRQRQTFSAVQRTLSL